MHAAVAKPVEMRVRAGPDTATPMLSQIRHYLSPPGRAELFRGFHIAALRDVFGFAAYFAAFVAVRDFCRGAVMEHLSESSSAGGAGQTLRPHPPSLRAELPPGYEIGCAAFGGAAAGVAGYCVRSPFNTLYKVGTGHRDGSARLLSLQRFASSPRGARAVVTGSLTFGTSNARCDRSLCPAPRLALNVHACTDHHSDVRGGAHVRPERGGSQVRTQGQKGLWILSAISAISLERE